MLILACWIGPAIAVIVVSGQSTLPSDTLFGREMHATGWAGALVVLSFAGSWFFPLLTSVVAGDVFSSEDRYGTWATVLTRSRSRAEIFAGKTLTLFQSDGAVVEEFRIGKLGNMMAFDAGEYEWK